MKFCNQITAAGKRNATAQLANANKGCQPHAHTKN